MYKQKKKNNRFTTAQKQAIYIDHGPSSLVDKEYPTRLNFYQKPPPADITIEEFEMLALDRLQVLKTVENASLRNRQGNEYKAELDRAAEKHLPMHSNLSRSSDLYNERRNDHISHFVLRLAYCRSEELRAWFVRQECALFKFRFENESAEERKLFMTTLDLSWATLDAEEKERIRDKLEACCSWSMSKLGPAGIRKYVDGETYFKVDFEKVPELVSRRSAYVSKGKVYVPMAEQISLVMDEFRVYLEKALDATAKVLPVMQEDDRLKPILMNIEKYYVGKDYGAEGPTSGDVRAKDVDGLIRHHAPLCMKNLHTNLRRDKHLRHGGRMQYGLFLKAIGLSIEEALVFWRMAFSNMTDDKFRKDYAYNIRHNYGLEGHRKNYSAYSCSKIIMSNPPSTGDHHGCPFRHFSNGNLESRLHNEGLGPADVRDIMQLVKDKHYQVACTRYFEVTHQKENVDTIEHPNQYFEQSKALVQTPEDVMEIE